MWIFQALSGSESGEVAQVGIEHYLPWLKFQVWMSNSHFNVQYSKPNHKQHIRFVLLLLQQRVLSVKQQAAADRRGLWGKANNQSRLQKRSSGIVLLFPGFLIRDCRLSISLSHIVYVHPHFHTCDDTERLQIVRRKKTHVSWDFHNNPSAVNYLLLHGAAWGQRQSPTKWICFFHGLFHRHPTYDSCPVLEFFFFLSSCYVSSHHNTHTLTAGTWQAIWGSRHLLTFTQGKRGEYVSVCLRERERRGRWRWVCDRRGMRGRNDANKNR